MRALSRQKRARQAQKLTERAVAKFGELRTRKVRPPLDQLILSMLWHLTSVRRATRALREIMRSFVDWNEVRISHPVEVASVLSSARWAREAGERVVWLLRELYEAYNRTNLDFLLELTPPQARSCLSSLPMVQRSLADEVLLFSLRVPVLPCTPGAARMCHRLGILDNDRATLKNTRILAKMFEPDYYASVHLLFCDCAEKLCLPDEPLCDQCPMKPDCRWR